MKSFSGAVFVGVLKSVSLEQCGRGKGSRASIRFRNRSHPTPSRYYLSALARATPHANGRSAAAQGHLHLDGWHIPSPWRTHELRVKQSVGNGAKRLVCIQEALPSFRSACSLWIGGWHPCPGWTLCFSAHTKLRSGCRPRPGCCLGLDWGKTCSAGSCRGQQGCSPRAHGPRALGPGCGRLVAGGSPRSLATGVSPTHHEGNGESRPARQKPPSFVTKTRK